MGFCFKNIQLLKRFSGYGNDARLVFRLRLTLPFNETGFVTVQRLPRDFDFLTVFSLVTFDFDFDSCFTGSSSSLVYHQAAMITSATTTKITRAVFLSNPEVAAGVGEDRAAFLKLEITT